jgi:phosphotransacetylase
MKNLLNDLKSKLREQPERRRIVFPEARFDPRVAQAVASLAEEQLVVPQVLCSLDELRQLEGVDTDALTSAVDSSALQVLDISDELRQQAEELYATRRAKEGKSPEQVRELMRNPIMLAAALVALGEADGLVAGAATATADVLRASLKLIGLSEGIRTMSSCFIMVLDNPQWG